MHNGRNVVVGVNSLLSLERDRKIKGLSKYQVRNLNSNRLDRYRTDHKRLLKQKVDNPNVEHVSFINKSLLFSIMHLLSRDLTQLNL